MQPHGALASSPVPGGGGRRGSQFVRTPCVPAGLAAAPRPLLRRPPGSGLGRSRGLVGWWLQAPSCLSLCICLSCRQALPVGTAPRVGSLTRRALAPQRGGLSRRKAGLLLPCFAAESRLCAGTGSPRYSWLQTGPASPLDAQGLAPVCRGPPKGALYRRVSHACPNSGTDHSTEGLCKGPGARRDHSAGAEGVRQGTESRSGVGMPGGPPA